jgi:hypothetical protein
MQFKYKVGDFIKYYGRVVYDDVRTGCWKESGIKWGKIVKLHPENRRCYEVCPDCSSLGTDRVSERAVIGIIRQF